ncbi:MAG: hypothetical protein O2829_05215 [Bacteroidetes bacterium]|nr:hypothetical protein [Bacteroidota bacterium]MDA1268476.1 hypothetical protein [Bacteroidota bacterium]
MENDSLESLSAFLEDSIFLLEADQKIIAEELMISVPSKPILSEEQQKNTYSSKIEHKEIQLTNYQETKLDLIEDLIPIKGNFSKGILVLHEESSLSTEVMDMLVKMLNACGHSMTEVGLLAAENLENRSMEEFKALNAHVVLKFGRIKHPINQLPIISYEIHTEGETEYLFSDALTSISEDKALKRQLWGALQLLFNLSTGTK